jgi:hypothetical protein
MSGDRLETPDDLARRWRERAAGLDAMGYTQAAYHLRFAADELQTVTYPPVMPGGFAKRAIEGTYTDADVEYAKVQAPLDYKGDRTT